MIQLVVNMKQSKPLTKRQEVIVSFVQQQGRAQNQSILKELRVRFDAISRITLVRDLNDLVHKRTLKKTGRGRGVWYEAVVHPFLRDVHADQYFRLEEDERYIQKNKIDFSARTYWEKIFTPAELRRLHLATADFRRRIILYSPQQKQKELERITIEFSWKSSRIEGNTYSLLDTERLIKSHEEAKGHTHQEALMILNHKAACEYVWKHPRYFKTLSLQKIVELHSLIVKNLRVSTGLRTRPVGIIGTAYRPHDNQHQIRDALQEMIKLANRMRDPFIKSLIAIAGLSYIQPFEDGNKRTSRILGNALLMANLCCPLSYRAVDETAYKKAIIIFYEQHALVPFKKLFIEQYQFAVKNYFL